MIDIDNVRLCKFTLLNLGICPQFHHLYCVAVKSKVHVKFLACSMISYRWHRQKLHIDRAAAFRLTQGSHSELTQIEWQCLRKPSENTSKENKQQRLVVFRHVLSRLQRRTEMSKKFPPVKLGRKNRTCLLHRKPTVRRFSRSLLHAPCC